MRQESNPARREPYAIAPDPTASPISRGERLGFVARAALVTAGVFAGLFVLWRVRAAVLLMLLAIVVATVLVAAAAPVQRRTGLSYRWSLSIVTVVLFLAIGAMAWLMGSQISTQVGELITQLPQAVEALENRLGISLSDLGQNALGAPGDGSGFSEFFSAAQRFFGSLISLGQTIVTVFAGLILSVIGGLILAADLDTYRVGIVKLFPKRQHERIDEALRDCGNALRLWLLAQLVAMAMIGVLVGAGVWLIGLPAPLALGLFAGVTEFIPYAGPWLGAVPAVLLALTQGGGTTLWTIGLFVAVQLIESYAIMPLVQQEMVEIPAALVLFATIAVGLLFGVIGVLVATPLTVIVYVLVNKLYVRDTLGVPTAVPGETE
ncbi:MAG: AI-2E family transporter [Alphaproteobacteria bacterium]